MAELQSVFQAGELMVHRYPVVDQWLPESRQAEWDDFIESHLPEYGYRDFSWSRAWWEAYARGNRVEIFLLRQVGSGAVVGLLPMWVERSKFRGFPVRRLEILGRGLGCEDLLIEPRAASQTRAALREIFATTRWDIARFTNLRLTAITSALKIMAAKSGFIAETWTSSRLQIETTGSYQAYLQARRRSFRKNFRAAVRRAKALGQVSFEKRNLSEMSDAELDAAQRIAKQGWQYDRGTSHFARVGKRSLIELLVESQTPSSGEVEVWMMLIDGEAVALNVGVFKAGRLEGIEQAYAKAYASCSPGLILMQHAIEKKFEDPRADLFILGTGESYQEKIADGSETVDNLILFNGNRYATLVSALGSSRGFHYLRRLMRRK